MARSANLRLSVALLLSLATAVPIRAGSPPERPNVVLFFVDDMGWADWERSALNPNGSVVFETPNLSRLANSGVVFDNGYASSPVCSPSRVSLMTGLSPARHRTTDFIGAGTPSIRGVGPPTGWSQNLAASEVTIAEALLDEGYNTGFFGKWHLGQGTNPSANPLANGYRVNVGGTNSGNPGFAGGFFAGADGMWDGMPGLSTPGEFASDAYLSDALSDRAADFVTSSTSAGEPFFLTMSHYLVHTPIQAPQDLVTKYTNKINQLQSRGVDLNGHDNPTYAGMVEKLDQSVGRVLDRLEDPNGDQDLSDSVLDDTIIVFTSDNGGLTSFSVTENGPLREGKGSIYEGGIREPYVISWAGNANVGSGVVNSTNVVTHDLYPTLLSLTGVQGNAAHNARLEGIDLAPALAGQTLDRGPIVWHYPHHSPQDSSDNGSIVNGGQFVSAVRDGDWKLIWFHEQARYELYNLASDLGETTSVLAANAEVAMGLSVELRRNLAETDAQMPEATFGDRGRLPLELPPVAQFEAPLPFTTFDQAHDFATSGVVSTPWDGVQNTDNANVFASSGGQLDLQSVGTTLLPDSFTAPFVYEEVTGDFDARIDIGQMTSANFHVLALVAADPAGDMVWVGQQDRTGENDFAQSRSHTGATRDEQTLAGDFEHYRLVRDGDELRGYVSEDGLFWRQFASYLRGDLPETLRVGVSQASFGQTTVTASVDSFTLAPYSSLPGDFNGNGAVDSADYAVWRDGLGERFVQSDYDVWKLHFGTTAANTPLRAAIPEPAAIGLAALACLLRRTLVMR
ncbi:MAG: sulfatase-like hydrolase/transferase [Planctomycetota bacterium]